MRSKRVKTERDKCRLHADILSAGLLPLRYEVGKMLGWSRSTPTPSFSATPAPSDFWPLRSRSAHMLCSTWRGEQRVGCEQRMFNSVD